MKTKMIIVSALFFSMVFMETSEAQFLKKLKNRVEQTVEETVINKTANKAAEKASRSMDKVFDANLGSGKQGKRVVPENIPGSFDFEYQYRLTMTTDKGAMDLDYFLTPGASYLGSKINAGMEMFMVMDGDENITYMFMDSGGNKMATATQVDLSDIEEDDEFDTSGFTITDLPNKTYLGYDCIGKQMENADYVFTLYFTNDALISFNDVFKTDSDRVPPALRSQLKDYEGALMMYMDMKDKKNKGKKNTSGTMECTLLEPVNFSFNTSGYTFM
ncbi:DUF4412 domain-containing protein [Arenibacter sp. GZD96]|uniref:hypothetical protein n=1 Tax=Aurantibrevibacter litoralis TaxID=3106030 RepID=UPI002AFE65E1|nr:hypothetical protein [Arenibacter sp. GZD-96]MEA1787207.1 DUF4412 domain-containing protein [Arenibacter sp. GZD-96]